MTIETVFSIHEDPALAVAELKQKLAGMAPRFLLFFVAPDHDPARVGEAVKSAFDCPSLGGTTAGELVSGKFLEGSITMMAFDDEHVGRVRVEAVRDTSSDRETREAYGRLMEGVAASAADRANYLGLVLHDGMGGGEETVMSALSSLSNIPFIGGSAGDGGRFEAAHVFVNGEPSTRSAGLALLELRRDYRILKTQSFDTVGEVLRVTRVDEASRRVIEFNGKPAAEEYARALGVETAELVQHFGSHPLGLLVQENEPFVRSPQQIQGTDVVFYCNIKEGMELEVLESRDIVGDTKSDLSRAIAEFGNPEALINFHCILRTLELKKKQQMEDYAKIFESVRCMGFSTYGESYIGHINQTSVIVLFA